MWMRVPWDGYAPAAQASAPPRGPPPPATHVAKTAPAEAALALGQDSVGLGLGDDAVLDGLVDGVA